MAVQANETEMHNVANGAATPNRNASNRRNAFDDDHDDVLEQLRGDHQQREDIAVKDRLLQEQQRDAARAGTYNDKVHAVIGGEQQRIANRRHNQNQSLDAIISEMTGDGGGLISLLLGGTALTLSMAWMVVDRNMINRNPIPLTQRLERWHIGQTSMKNDTWRPVSPEEQKRRSEASDRRIGAQVEKNRRDDRVRRNSPTWRPAENVAPTRTTGQRPKTASTPSQEPN